MRNPQLTPFSSRSFFTPSGRQDLRSSPWCWVSHPSIHHAHHSRCASTSQTWVPSLDNICFCTGVYHLPANTDFDRLIVHSVIAVHLLRLAEWHAPGECGGNKNSDVAFWGCTFWGGKCPGCCSQPEEFSLQSLTAIKKKVNGFKMGMFSLIFLLIFMHALRSGKPFWVSSGCLFFSFIHIHTYINIFGTAHHVKR